MDGDLAAVIMGCAALVIFFGYRAGRKSRQRREKEELIREFTRNVQKPREEGKETRGSIR